MILEAVGACLVTYAVHESAADDYARTIVRAQRIVTDATGIRFAEVAGDADVTYTQYPRFVLNPVAEGETAVLGEWVPAIRTVRLTTQFHPARLPLVLHETLHAVGVGHVEDPAAVMAPTLSGVVDLTPADLAAMQGVTCE